eukprot:Tbor_TRINITY_DN6221_c4_g2::TRINITY_DN6221_c4_g2_i7::g.2037::m.2037
MKLFQVALLLLVQLSPFVHGNSEADNKCVIPESGIVGVPDNTAKLTKCVQEGKGITFDLKAMYDAKAAKTTVEISITEAAFINSYIKLTNGDNIPESEVPLLFTMSKTKMSGTSSLEFGIKETLFKLPPKSSISIVDSQMTISLTSDSFYMFTFHGLQLVTKSSIEIARNVITMECTGCEGTGVFRLRQGKTESPGMVISGESSFTVKDNKITMNGNTRYRALTQRVWYQYKTPLTVSGSSTYTWASNVISMVGSTERILNQHVWNLYSDSVVTISESSTFAWSMNSISMN